MTAEEAIRELKTRLKHVADINLNGQMAFKMAIESLEKQIPKKPIMEKWNPALCPCCKAELSEHMGDGYYHHWDGLGRCPECGQELNWDERSEDR